MPNGGNHEEQQEMQGVEEGEGRGARGGGAGPGGRGRREARRRSRSEDAQTKRKREKGETRDVGPLGTVPQRMPEAGGLQRRKRSSDGRPVEGAFQTKRSGSRESTPRNTRHKDKKEKKEKKDKKDSDG